MAQATLESTKSITGVTNAIVGGRSTSVGTFHQTNKKGEINLRPYLFLAKPVPEGQLLTEDDMLFSYRLTEKSVSALYAIASGLVGLDDDAICDALVTSEISDLTRFWRPEKGKELGESHINSLKALETLVRENYQPVGKDNTERAINMFVAAVKLLAKDGVPTTKWACEAFSLIMTDERIAAINKCERDPVTGYFVSNRAKKGTRKKVSFSVAYKVKKEETWTPEEVGYGMPTIEVKPEPKKKKGSKK